MLHRKKRARYDMGDTWGTLSCLYLWRPTVAWVAASNAAAEHHCTDSACASGMVIKGASVGSHVRAQRELVPHWLDSSMVQWACMFDSARLRACMLSAHCVGYTSWSKRDMALSDTRDNGWSKNDAAEEQK